MFVLFFPPALITPEGALVGFFYTGPAGRPFCSTLPYLSVNFVTGFSLRLWGDDSMADQLLPGSRRSRYVFLFPQIKRFGTACSASSPFSLSFPVHSYLFFRVLANPPPPPFDGHFPSLDRLLRPRERRPLLPSRRASGTHLHNAPPFAPDLSSWPLDVFRLRVVSTAFPSSRSLLHFSVTSSSLRSLCRVSLTRNSLYDRCCFPSPSWVFLPALQLLRHKCIQLKFDSRLSSLLF